MFLTGLDDAKITKYGIANSEGIKTERPNIGAVNKGQFDKYDSTDDLYQVLFLKV